MHDTDKGTGIRRMPSRGDGAYLLDGLLDRGRHLLCTAVDDMHGHLPDFALAWVMVKSLERFTRNHLME